MRESAERTRLAEIERDNLEIVKQFRADPEIVEYESYSHSPQSEKEHSLTVTVSSNMIDRGSKY
jgi:hypothetical protein